MVPRSSFAGTYDLALSPDGKTLYALNSGISEAVVAVTALVAVSITLTHPALTWVTLYRKVYARNGDF